MNGAMPGMVDSPTAHLDYIYRHHRTLTTIAGCFAEDGWSWSASHFQHVAVTCYLAAAWLPSALAFGDLRWPCAMCIGLMLVRWVLMSRDECLRWCMQWHARLWDCCHNSVHRSPGLKCESLRVHQCQWKNGNLLEASQPRASCTSSCTARLSNLVQSCATLLFVKIPLLDAVESLAVSSLRLSFRPRLAINRRHQIHECNYCILLRTISTTVLPWHKMLASHG